MTAVVSDTTPLNYLALTGCVEILPQLFAVVLIPPAVQREMLHPNAPPALQALVRRPPPWLKLQAPTQTVIVADLDDGEREAITLALELGHEALLLDEHDGRAEAARRGLATVGTIGLLLKAAELGLVDLPAVASRLKQTNFRAARALWLRLEGK